MNDLELELERVSLQLEREEFNSALDHLKNIRKEFPDYKTKTSKPHLVDFYEGQAIFRGEMKTDNPNYERLLQAKKHFEHSIETDPNFAGSNYLDALVSVVLSEHQENTDPVYFDLNAKHRLQTAISIRPQPELVAEILPKLSLTQQRLQHIYSISLCTKDKGMLANWEKEFRDFPWISLVYGDILGQEADAIVSPTNSFGFMDGGLDYKLSKYFGWDLQKRLQKIIEEKHDGELLVGKAEIIGTRDDKIPYLISAPTMRIPMNIQDTINPYLATRAVFLAMEKFNENGANIKSVLIPAMGAGVGKVPFNICARQMRTAYEDVVLKRKKFPKDIGDAQQKHRILSTDHYHRLYGGSRD